MQTYIKGEITITAAQFAKARRDIRKRLHEAVWSDGWDSLLQEFDAAFDEFCSELDIEWNGDAISPDFEHGRFIIGPEAEVAEFGNQQSALLGKILKQDRSEAMLDECVDQLLKLTLDFLGIKIKASRVKAPQKPAKAAARLRRVA